MSHSCHLTLGVFQSLDRVDEPFLRFDVPCLVDLLRKLIINQIFLILVVLFQLGAYYRVLVEVVLEVLVLFPLQKVIELHHPPRTCLLTFNLISSLSNVKFGEQGVFELALCPKALLFLGDFFELTIHILLGLTLDL